MKKVFCFGVFLMLVFCSVPGSADVPVTQREEVLHLLDFMKKTDCTIERNGTSYSGEEAFMHIANKYAHFRDRISSTEAFIEYSATRSTMSGSYYTVHCDGSESMKTGDWLLEELRIYRDRDDEMSQM